MKQKKLKPSETSKVIADDIRREMSKSEDILLNAYFDDMGKFVIICHDMTSKQIIKDKHSKVYMSDIDEIIQQVCYVMLNKGVSRDMFDNNTKTMRSYVSVLIRSCIVRLGWGRDKYGDGYVLR
jgi:hypothetical protein